MRQAIVCNLFILFFLAHDILCQNNPVIVKIENNKNVVRFQLSAKSRNVIYQTNKLIIRDLTVSPTGKFLAFIETTEGTISGYEYKTLPKNEMLILDPSGNVAFKFKEDVRKYAWSPDGNKIAYITGAFREEGIGFSPEAAYYFDLDTKSKIKVDGLKYPYDINWNVSPDFFCIKLLQPIDNNRIFKFDVDKLTLSPTPFHDLHFSPDGKFYYHLWDTIDAQFRIFIASSNQELPREIYSGLGSPLGWAFNTGHLFLFVKKNEQVTLAPSKGPIAVVKERKLKSIKYSIFDVEQKTVVKELENVKIGEWISQNSYLPYVKDGKIMVMDKPANE